MPLLLAMSLAIPAIASTAAADRVAFVDLRRAIAESAEGKEIRKALQAELEGKQKELAGKREELRKLGLELQKQEGVLGAKEFAEKRRGFQEKVAKFEEETAQLKQELAKKEAEALKPLAEKVLLVVATIAQREKVTHVLRQEALVWTESRAMDLTNEVIRLADAAHAKSKEKEQKAESRKADGSP